MSERDQRVVVVVVVVSCIVVVVAQIKDSKRVL